MPNVPLEVTALSFSISYFLVDTYFGIVYKFNGIQMVTHHVLSIILSLSVILSGSCSYTVTLAFMLGEMSNPFLLTKMMAGRHSHLADVSYFATLIFSAVFLIARGPLALYYAEICFSRNLGIVLRVTLAAACCLTRVLVSGVELHGF